MAMHAGQLAITAEQVRGLVADQFPAWGDLPVRAVASAGTVNALFRLGDGLVARFPLVPGDVDAVRRQLASEAAAAPLHGRITAPTPSRWHTVNLGTATHCHGPCRPGCLDGTGSPTTPANRFRSRTIWRA